MRITSNPLPVLILLALALALSGDSCEGTSADCAAEPIGHIDAFLERSGAPSVSEFVGMVTSFGPVPDGFQRVVVRLATDQSESLKVLVPRNLLHLNVGWRYSFRVEYVGGRPSASALVVSDSLGLVFAGATDMAVGQHVLKEGLPGFDIRLTEGGCSSRDQSTCYDAVVNRRLDVSTGGSILSLWNGQFAAAGKYRVTCLTAQHVEYSSQCADAGVPAVSWAISRESS